MTAQTFSARMVAREVSKALGREVSDKRVRSWVRDNVDAYDDDGYTQHAYDRRLADRIVAGMTKSAKAPRAAAAHTGRAKAPKAKATPKATGTTDAPSS